MREKENRKIEIDRKKERERINKLTKLHFLINFR